MVIDVAMHGWFDGRHGPCRPQWVVMSDRPATAG